jgi:hypothetical protein
MVPPRGPVLGAAIDSDRKAAGDVLFKNGHMARDWLRSDSMAAILLLSFRYGVFFGMRLVGKKSKLTTESSESRIYSPLQARVTGKQSIWSEQRGVVGRKKKKKIKESDVLILASG